MLPVSADAELEEYLEVVRRLAEKQLSVRERVLSPDRLVVLRRVLDQAGVLDLATETVELDGATRWLSGTVATIARRSPAIAFALASRYAAQRALAAIGEDATGAAAGRCSGLDDQGRPKPLDESCVALPVVLDPGLVVVIDGLGQSGAVVPRTSLHDEEIARSGLDGAELRTFRLGGDGVRVLPAPVAVAASRDLELLISSVMLGAAEGTLEVSEQYAGERRQFGAPIGSFAGLRAILAEMRHRVDVVRGLLERALLERALAAEGDESDVRVLEVSAAAGRAVVQVAIDAIQVHGGYGYIEEYPVAGLLPDAVSLRAAALPRRLVMARLADDRLGALV